MGLAMGWMKKLAASHSKFVFALPLAMARRLI